MTITSAKHNPRNAQPWVPSAHDAHTVRCEDVVHLTPRQTRSYDRSLGDGIVLGLGETRHGDEYTR